MNKNEQKIIVSGGQQRETIFKKVPASELRLDDEFMKHNPKTFEEYLFMKKVETAIKSGLKNFWRPVFDPSIDANGRICYEAGKRPAVGKSYDWWEKNAKKFCPERGSRLGTKSEYVAFLSVFIKELVASGNSLEWAWNAVCNDSKELGHYWNFTKSKKYNFERTASREVCGWCDLGNTFKILANDKETGGLWLAGGPNTSNGNDLPLADLYYDDDHHIVRSYCCGWLVFDSCPDC